MESVELKGILTEMRIYWIDSELRWLRKMNEKNQ